MQLKQGLLDHPAVLSLLEQHHEAMKQFSPPESIHALDLSGLSQDSVSFWTLWFGDELAGCGAIKYLSATHAEIKSMRTATCFLRKGVARLLLEHLLLQAQKKGINQVSLETGSMEAFAPAHKLYQSFGFNICVPFADYTKDPYSLFMTKKL